MQLITLDWIAEGNSTFMMMSSDFCSCGAPWRDIDDQCFRCKKVISPDRLELLPLHRQIDEIGDCKCAETVTNSWGSRSTKFDGLFLCNFCDLRSNALHSVREESNSTDAEQIVEKPTKTDISISGRSAKQNLELVESLLSNLAETKKYKRAITGGEFALFSFIGTNDWEDYASLSIDALQLLTLAQINNNLEEIRRILEEK